jgi:hypothetical protein
MADERGDGVVPRAPGAEWRVLSRDGERTIEHAHEGILDELVIDE